MGEVPSGVSYVVNESGRPEAVLTLEQWEALSG